MPRSPPTPTSHPHQGVLDAYDGAPPRPALSAEDLATLARGEPVLQQQQTASGSDAAGRGVAVLDIHAEPSVIWSKILDYPSYPGMVDHVKSTAIYERKGDHLYVEFVIGAPLVNIRYYIDHTVHTEQGWLTWRLNYRRTSDFDDTVGYWRVDALPERPGWSRVSYSADVKARGWVPAPIERAFATIGLKTSVAWLAREAEAAARASGNPIAP
ncbi:MAG: SRPBCC family protein [Myxococcota bacterium]